VRGSFRQNPITSHANANERSWTSYDGDMLLELQVRAVEDLEGFCVKTV
jgi:hypothetical protein